MNLKEHFDWALVSELSIRASTVDSSFNTQNFKKTVNPKLLSLEMKDRVIAIATALYTSLEKPYTKNLPLLLSMIDDNKHGLGELRGFSVWVIAYIVERYGLNNPELSLQALHKITQHFTAEFAIRPYLQQHRELTLKVLQQWTTDPSDDVRRLVSEGIRPRLPWGIRVEWLIEDPSDIFLLLDKLYEDESDYVRRSVANNLNDISKDHPDKVIHWLKKWQDKPSDSKNLDWLIRHSCRSLIKQSHIGALQLQGYSPTPNIIVKLFEVQPNEVVLGESFNVVLTLHNNANSIVALLIDLQLFSPSSTTKQRQRILKWCRKEIAANSSLTLEKKWPIKHTTIRTEKTGNRQVNLIINGQKMNSVCFEVVEPKN